MAFFTAHERNELKDHWGSRSTRLTRDSFLPFGSCQLCLLPARDPVACPSHGHLFCRECAISNLLAQNKDLKRLKKAAEQRKAEDEEEKGVQDAEEKMRAVEEFERVQAGLRVRSGGEKKGERIVDRADGKVTVEQDVEGGNKGVKRKFEVDEKELMRLGSEQNGDAKRADRGWKTDGKTELPAFWAPSQIPDNQKAEVKDIKQHPTCPAAAEGKAHEFTLKTLVTVNFSGDKTNDDADQPPRTCPSCNKTLSNSTKAMLAKPCGHVLCKPCSDKFQRPAEKSAHDAEHDDNVSCYVCSEDITPGKKVKRKKDEDGGKKEKGGRGLVELSSEGTGFAAGAGGNMVRKQGVAFQC